MTDKGLIKTIGYTIALIISVGFLGILALISFKRSL